MVVLTYTCSDQRFFVMKYAYKLNQRTDLIVLDFVTSMFMGPRMLSSKSGTLLGKNGCIGIKITVFIWSDLSNPLNGFLFGGPSYIWRVYEHNSVWPQRSTVEQGALWLFMIQQGHTTNIFSMCPLLFLFFCRCELFIKVQVFCFWYIFAMFEFMVVK